MRIIYATQDVPQSFEKSIFLVGPTPRHPDVPSWRPLMLEALEGVGYEGVVFVPEDEGGEWKHSYTDQVEWEHSCLDMSDLVVAWIPRDLETMPALTTNIEFGSLLTSGKLLYGRPEEAVKMKYLDHCYQKMWGRVPHTNMVEMADEVMSRLGVGDLRTGGERKVPFVVWKTRHFQEWYRTHKKIGNRLDDAKVLWPFFVGPRKNFLFSFSLWVKVWISSEGRYKENEYIFSRPDISTILAYRKTKGDFLDTEVVLVREFRSPSRTKDGFIRELPGGSSWKPNKSPEEIASEELEEETNLVVSPGNFEKVYSKQVAGTLSTYHAHLFSVELTEEQMEQARKLAKENKAFGVEEDSERTYAEVSTIRHLLSGRVEVDWSTLGMIFAGLHRI